MRDKRGSFIRLANARTNKALKKLELVGNLSNPQTYSYTKEDVDKIKKTLKAGVKEAIKRFRIRLKGKNPDFDF